MGSRCERDWMAVWFGNWEYGLWKKTLVQNLAMPLWTDQIGGKIKFLTSYVSLSLSILLSLKEELTILIL